MGQILKILEVFKYYSQTMTSIGFCISKKDLEAQYLWELWLNKYNQVWSSNSI